MPTLYPSTATTEISNYHERLVVDKLMATLPDQCLIFHSFETLSWERLNNHSPNRVLREREVDVIVFWPSKGLIVLEVKGGEIGYDGRNWTSRNAEGRHDISDPFKQARKNLHEIVEILKVGQDLKNDSELGIARAYAAVFPDCCYEGAVPADAQLPAGATKAIVCDSRNFEQIDKFISKALYAFSGRHEAHQHAIQSERVKQILLPEFKLVPCMSSKIRNEREEFLRLTDAQYMVLDALSNTSRASIPGSAGTGKTLLAVEQAKRFSQQGLRTLVLCFTEALAEWLTKLTADDINGNIDVFHFHGLCKAATESVDEQYKIPESMAERTTFFYEQAPKLLRKYAQKSDHVYEAVVVDEGQDFRESWWVALDSCINEESKLFVFHDKDQDVFRARGLEALDLHELGVFPLSRNCRNTQAIATFCEEYTGIRANVTANAPVGESVVVEVRKEKFERRSMAIACVRDWLSIHRLEPSQILIVSPFRAENTVLSDVQEIGGIPIVTSIDEWRSNEGILISTSRAIKGLEASVVLLIDAVQPGSHPAFGPEDFYVACTRAQNQLYVIASEALAKQYKAAA